MLDVMLALANSVRLLALSHAHRHVLDSLLCAGLIALCCVVLAVDAGQQARTHKKGPQKPKNGQVRSSLKTNEKNGKRLIGK